MNLSPIVKRCELKNDRDSRQLFLYDSEVLPDFAPEMLNSAYWQQNGAVTGEATGRGTTYFVRHQHTDMVLRHYYRGGLVGKYIDDSYLYTGFDNTRAVREFRLLENMQQWQLPAPKPVALRIERQLLSYRADILIERIANARDLVVLLSETEVAAKLWQRIGATIRRFHDKGVYHHDLNAHNILLDDDGKVWLIDFDQGKVMGNNGRWQEANMQRLLRSFRKELGRLPTFHWQETDWHALMQGYQAT